MQSKPFMHICDIYTALGSKFWENYQVYPYTVILILMVSYSSGAKEKANSKTKRKKNGGGGGRRSRPHGAW